MVYESFTLFNFLALTREIDYTYSMKLLVVEDNNQLNKALTTLLKRQSFLVDSASDGEEALLYIKQSVYDVIILDIMLPKIDGLEVLRRVREEKNSTPIILLTAKTTIHDKIVGLNMGADDYLPKPFSMDELIARVRALSRRQNTIINPETMLSFGDIIVSAKSYTMNHNKYLVNLSNKELEIMRILIKNQGQVVSLETITKLAWETNDASTSENVWVYISYLRKKLEAIHSKVKIKSIRYKGYYLEMK